MYLCNYQDDANPSDKHHSEGCQRVDFARYNVNLKVAGEINVEIITNGDHEYRCFT